MTKNQYADAAINFEAVKYSLNQNKDGVKVTLVIHPDDVPTPLISASVGSRYMVVMVEVDDEDQPIDRQLDQKRTVQSAALLCKEPSFQRYLLGDEAVVGTDEAEKATTETLRYKCDIESRKELATNKEAREVFEEMRRSYLVWRDSDVEI